MIGTIAAGISIVGGVSGMLGGLSASKKAKKITKANLKTHDITTFANMKQMSREADQLLGENRGRIYASNLMMSGSSESFMTGLESELDKEMGWMKAQADAERKSIKAGGAVAASGARSAGWQSLFSGLGTAASIIAKD